ncbi:uncharacterized protein BT62DRAFT_1076116 [Guyanagaster necrorhizus]|uniref:F-box domain-containing protein n=1 Tax=Guyanagaster necrorhizus TaxID=856835 RepID=A0A9P7VTS1_9AGAR|nr:uncharacterized protein BT62DRAFT_1076116 [Guyanagaster necrorhizus MCA 3950]KAG7446560.1 hypothetical protein BT62DRAFT_1076116 [Guyanagaster necrorhizus MCA 3950]
MIFYESLPVEIILEILAYLQLSSLASFVAVSRSTKLLVDANESTVFRNAAVVHGLISSDGTQPADLRAKYTPRSLQGVDGWKSFCRRQIGIKFAWKGKSPSSARRLAYASLHRQDVHRLKVDERAGIIMTTYRNGGLAVADIATNRILWSLPSSHVVPHAHCEYDNGFLIFNRAGRRKEVWRLVEGQNQTIMPPSTSPPDQTQLAASTEAATEHHNSYPKGHFVPWSLIVTPTITYAFRFVYPTLFAATETNFFVYDIPGGKLLQSIIVNPPDSLTHLHYVDISERHLFLCGWPNVVVFSRETGKSILKIPSYQLNYANKIYAIAKQAHPVAGSALLHHDVVSRPAESTLPPQVVHIADTFTAVHVSACGRHLTVLLSSSRLLIIPYFERLITGEVELQNITLDIELGSRSRISRYLAFENERVAVVTDTGLFVVHWDLEKPLVICRAPIFGVMSALPEVTCLQMTDTGMYLTWKHPITTEVNEEDFERLLDEEVSYTIRDTFAQLLVQPTVEPNETVESHDSAVCMIDFVVP